MALYPFKFKPAFLEKLWGGRKLDAILGMSLPPNVAIGEAWTVFDFPPGEIEWRSGWCSAEVATGPLAGWTLHELIEAFTDELMGSVATVGEHRQFPLLIKFLDARCDLSIQCHPSPEYARAHPESHLKNECWFILQREPGARILRGLKQGVTRERFRDALAEGTVERLAHSLPVEAGECHWLPSGIVHALGAGILALEVQTPSDTTFRLSDFGRVDPRTGKPRLLHIDQALACLDFLHPAEALQPQRHLKAKEPTDSKLISCPEFTLERLRFVQGVEALINSDEKPVVWIMISGQAEIFVDGLSESVPLGQADCVLLPARMRHARIRPRSDCVLVEVAFPAKPSPALD